MTFAQYAAQLGVLLLQWLPICGLMYLAVRLGVQHGSRYATQILVDVAQHYKNKATSTLSDEQRDKINRP